jgi:hypothetical protein
VNFRTPLRQESANLRNPASIRLLLDFDRERHDDDNASNRAQVALQHLRGFMPNLSANPDIFRRKVRLSLSMRPMGGKILLARAAKATREARALP